MGEMRMDYYRDDWNDPQDVSEEDHYAEVGELMEQIKDLKHEVAYLLAELMKARDTLVNGAPNEALDDLNWLISTANPEDRINALKILEEAS
jgi:uncharacterized small protein (DUF1192 family)